MVERDLETVLTLGSNRVLNTSDLGHVQALATLQLQSQISEQRRVMTLTSSCLNWYGYVREQWDSVPRRSHTVVWAFWSWFKLWRACAVAGAKPYRFAPDPRFGNSCGWPHSMAISARIVLCPGHSSLSRTRDFIFTQSPRVCCNSGRLSISIAPRSPARTIQYAESLHHCLTPWRSMRASPEIQDQRHPK